MSGHDPIDLPQAARLFLRGQPWYLSLDEACRTDVDAAVHCVRGGKGDCLFSVGEPVRGWYAVLSGLVLLQSSSADGRVQAFLGVPAGEWFGEGSALKAEPRRYEVLALRETVLLCLPTPVLRQLHATSLPFNQYLLAHLNRRLGQAMAMIEAARLRSPEERVALYLSRLFWPGTRKISLSQEELGHLAGLSRQTVNRVLRQMADDGLVALAFGRVEILDEPTLRRIGQGRPGPAA